MNFETLRRLARWSDKIATAQRDLSDALAGELSKAEAARDPLGLHIYMARAAFRRTADNDKSKSGKRTEVALWSSYREAQKLGFKGPAKLWELLMQSGVSADAAPSEATGLPPPSSRLD